ncbi:ABC transporter permease [Pantoea sp. App145]|uniref:ABC transporter permease n=1 Tax=Pantoea sp. App145 TaxID=3071567 RepID=UPI003A8110A7
MIRLIVRRVLQGIPLLLGVIVINFILIKSVPGTLLDVMTAEQQVTDPAMIAKLRHLYGLDQSVLMQLLKYIGSVLRFDLGFSYRQNMPVLDVILTHLPATLILMLASILLAVVVGVSAGVMSALRVNTLWDTLISAAAILCFAAPSFWLGIMMIIFFSVKLGWFPVGGMETIGANLTLWNQTLDIFHHLVLPGVALGLFYAATYTRVMRASMLEVGQMDFVRTARAKGLGGVRIIIHHTLRNALLPVVTLLGLQLGTVLGGSIVIEAVFSWPGIGQVLFDSVMSRNYPLTLGVLVLSSLLVIVINIMVDVLYLRLDPRIRS